VVGINDTGQPFYTSDHPVVRRANLTQGGRRLVGVRDPGIEFVFPLDSRHILLIPERAYFADWRRLDNKGAADDQTGARLQRAASDAQQPTGVLFG
jgi:hypothetical protein